MSALFCLDSSTGVGGGAGEWKTPALIRNQRARKRAPRLFRIKLLRRPGEKIFDYYFSICRAALWLALPLVAALNFMFPGPSVKPIFTLPISHAKYRRSI